MTSTSRISAAQSGAPTTIGRRGDAHAHAADFRAAFANAVGAADSAAGSSGGSERSKHVVKAGETLYGIANARLAAAGQPATPGASMRYALQIAKANQIRNPDRILAGQQLVLAPAAPGAAGNGIVTADTQGVAKPGAAVPAAVFEADEILARHDPDAPGDVPGIDVTAGGAASEGDARDHVRLDQVLPEPARTAAEDGQRSRAEQAAPSRVNLALYEQMAPVSASAAPPKQAGELPDIVYKGVVGKALDLAPLEPSTRTGLQQASAVVSSSLAGRSLAALTGLGGPVLTIAGLIWGIFSAQKISAMQADEPKQVAQSAPSGIAN